MTTKCCGFTNLSQLGFRLLPNNRQTGWKVWNRPKLVKFHPSLFFMPLIFQERFSKAKDSISHFHYKEKKFQKSSNIKIRISYSNFPIYLRDCPLLTLIFLISRQHWISSKLLVIAPSFSKITNASITINKNSLFKICRKFFHKCVPCVASHTDLYRL